MSASIEGSPERARFDSDRTIIWLASYPKSGNTWLRALLTACLNGGESPDLDHLVGGPLAFERQLLDDHAGISSAEYSFDELVAFQVGFHRELARAREAPFFIKTHSAFVIDPQGERLFPADASAGAICLVRDPVDIAPSYAHHLHCSLDEAIGKLAESGRLVDQWDERASSNVPQKAGSWSENVSSWLEQREVPILAVRYEDMLENTTHQLRRICDFVGIDAKPDLLDRAVEACSFDRLRQREADSGFVEKPSEGQAFFRKGQRGSGHCELTISQVQSIRRAHEGVMRELGYA